MAKAKNIIQQKQQELCGFQKQSEAAISLVTTTIKNLIQVNENIESKVREIEECQTQLDATKQSLIDTRAKNRRILDNFNALLNVGD